MTTVATQPEYLSVAETAQRLRMSRASVYRAVAARNLPAVRLNPQGVLRVPAAELERWRAEAKETP